VKLDLFYVYSPAASILICDFSYSCAALDKISTDIACCAVTVR